MPQAIIRTLLWIIIVFIFLRGVTSIINDNSIDKQRENLENYMRELSDNEEVKNKAIGFAENFVQEYFTCTGEKNSDYEYRVNQYLAQGLHINIPDIEVTALQVNAANITFVGDNRTDVDIVAIIDFAGSRKTLSIKVPVAMSNGMCVVDNLPQIIPMQEKASALKEYSNLNGSEVSDNVKSDLETVLSNFYKTYYEGNSSELSYYVTEDFPFEYGLQGSVEFIELESLRAFYDADKNEYNVKTAVSILVGGMELNQTIYLKIVSVDGRYYIKTISTR